MGKLKLSRKLNSSSQKIISIERIEHLQGKVSVIVTLDGITMSANNIDPYTVSDVLNSFVNQVRELKRK